MMPAIALPVTDRRASGQPRATTISGLTAVSSGKPTESASGDTDPANSAIANWALSGAQSEQRNHVDSVGAGVRPSVGGDDGKEVRRGGHARREGEKPGRSGVQDGRDLCELDFNACPLVALDHDLVDLLAVSVLKGADLETISLGVGGKVAVGERLEQLPESLVVAKQISWRRPHGGCRE